MKKTPEEIALEKYPVRQVWMPGKLAGEVIQKDRNAQDRAIWLDGYTSNNELEEFKKRLVEKVKEKQNILLLQISGDDRHPSILACGVLEWVIKEITQEDQPPVKNGDQSWDNL